MKIVRQQDTRVVRMPQRTFTYISVHTRKFSSIVRYVRHHVFVKLILGLLLLFLLFRIIKPNHYSYMMSYAKIIIEMVNTDIQHQKNATIQGAKILWDLHKLQMKYMRENCKEIKKDEQFAWLITMSGNRVVPGAVVVAHMIRKISCYPTIIALVTDTVSDASKTALTSVGCDVRQVESLDCNWMDSKMGHEIQNKGIPGTHTRFHAWGFTQYKTIIYVDTDFFPLVNIDELFETPHEFSAVYCGRPRVLDPCFNAGLAVFKPSVKIRDEILQMWKDLTYDLGCPSDQVVLWYYFAFNGRWNPLPYSYNVRRELYYPMKAYHFAGFFERRKPWEMVVPTTRSEATRFQGPIVERDDMDILWWKIFYQIIDEYSLQDWWKATEFYKPLTDK